MTTALSRDVSYYKEVISESWYRTVEGVLETAHHVVDAWENLNDDEWEDLKNNLPFGDSVRSMMMGIGQSKRFNKKTIQKKLPPNYNIIYEYSRLEDDEWTQAVQDGVVDTDITTGEVKKWKNSIRYPNQTTTTSQSTSSTKNYFAHIPTIDFLDENTREQVMDLLLGLEKKLNKLGVDLIFEQGQSSTPRQLAKDDAKQKLITKLESELSTELGRFNKEIPRKELDEIEETYFQFRFFQQNKKYPYDPDDQISIERNDHPYSISKMDFPTFMKLVRKKKVITQWTPIREYGIAGKAKCIKLAIDHTNATTTNQRANYKKQLKNIVSRNDKNAGHAKKYLDMLVEN